MNYEIRKNSGGEIISCAECNVETRTAEFSKSFGTGNQWLCFICSNVIGDNTRIVDKRMMSQYCHILLNELKK